MAMETLPLPQLDPDQVLVQVAAVGVCGSDVHYYEHGRIGPYVVDHPLVLGHELSGRIAAVGSAVDPARVGRRVAVEPQRPCRTCKQCKAGRYNLCPDIEFYATPPVDGAFAEYVTIQSDFAYDIPDSVSDEAAARDGADEIAFRIDDELAADGLRRRAPSFNHGGQRHLFARRGPFGLFR